VAAAHLAFGLRATNGLSWASWGDEHVVFDEVSGQTHQLDTLHALVLHLIEEKNQSLESLRDEILAATAMTDAHEVTARVPSICNELVLCGLIEALDQ
jgi:PqqD family protein of HPr-rel-A system